MNLKGRLTTGLVRHEFGPTAHLDWNEFRGLLNGILGDGADSLERKIDDIVGSFADYEGAKILAESDPQAKLDELVGRVDKAFSKLNNFYRALNESSLGYRAVFVGTEGQPVAIASFELQPGEGVPFKIAALQGDGEEFVSTNVKKSGVDPSFVGHQTPSVSKGNLVYGYKVESNGADGKKCTDEQLAATFAIFAQALVALRDLRIQLDKVQKKHNAITSVRGCVDEHIGSIQDRLSQQVLF